MAKKVTLVIEDNRPYCYGDVAHAFIVSKITNSIEWEINSRISVQDVEQIFQRANTEVFVIKRKR